MKHTIAAVTGLILVVLAGCGTGESENAATSERRHELLVVGYDIAREIVANLNAGFIEWYEAENPGVSVSIEASHAGSTNRARAVADGLDADLIIMNQFLDVELIVNETRSAATGPVVPEDWAMRPPNGASPWKSTMAFVVHAGNPLGIRDWDDLVRDGVTVVAPNYGTTGNGRFSYLTAWAFALQNGGSEAEAQQFVRRLAANTPLLATGGRDATNIFTERGMGDVLVTFESEANFIASEIGDGAYQVVVPSFGIDARAFVATAEVYAREKGNLEIAEAYWEFVFSREGQEIAARSYNRPTDPDVAAEFADRLPDLNLFEVQEVFGNWQAANDRHFAPGGTFDTIV